MGSKKTPYDDSPTMRLLSDLYPGEGHGLVELRAMRDGAVAKRVFTENLDRAQALVDEWSADRAQKTAVYAGIGRRLRRGGTKDDIASVPALWADVDVKKLGWNFEETVEDFYNLPGALQPSALVFTGGGLHAYWYLDIPYVLHDGVDGTERRDDIGYFEDVNRAFQTHMASDHVHDITRVLRMPGSFNHKSNKQARVLWSFPWHRHSIGYLEAAISAFDLYLSADGFVTEDALPDVGLAGKSDVDRAYGMATDKEYRGGWNKRWREMWDRTRLGGGRHPYHGLDEAQLLATAYLWGKKTIKADAKRELVIDQVLAETRVVKQRGAPGEQWDWDAEREKIAAKLDRWIPKYEYLAAARKAEEAKLRKEVQAAKRAADKAGKGNG